MDQSSGHGKRMEEGLNTAVMRVRYGGSQPKMQNITINKLGACHAQLIVVTALLDGSPPVSTLKEKLFIIF